MRSVPNLLLSAEPAVHFFFLKALPVAGAQIYYWVRDWQVLILGVLALFLAWRWSLTVERRAERIAREILGRALRLPPDVRDVDQASGSAAVQIHSETEAVRFEESKQHSPDIESLKSGLNSFRTGLRNILAATPVSDEHVPEKLKTACRRLAGISFSSFRILPELRATHATLLAQLDDGIGELEAMDPLTYRQLWQHLVDLNSMARALEEAILPDASNSAV